MKHLKDGTTKLSEREHAVLVEALRRRGRFNSTNQPITRQWTGLGTNGEYQAALQSGLMEPAPGANRNHQRWWTLTEKGARIVSHWTEKGYTVERVERGDVPIRTLPTNILTTSEVPSP